MHTDYPLPPVSEHFQHSTTTTVAPSPSGSMTLAYHHAVLYDAEVDVSVSQQQPSAHDTSQLLSLDEAAASGELLRPSRGPPLDMVERYDS